MYCLRTSCHYLSSIKLVFRTNLPCVLWLRLYRNQHTRLAFKKNISLTNISRPTLTVGSVKTIYPVYKKTVHSFNFTIIVLLDIGEFTVALELKMVWREGWGLMVWRCSPMLSCSSLRFGSWLWRNLVTSPASLQFIHSFILFHAALNLWRIIHSFIRLFTNSFTHSLIFHSLMLSFTHLPIHSLTHSLTRSFIYSFIHHSQHLYRALCNIYTETQGHLVIVAEYLQCYTLSMSSGLEFRHLKTVNLFLNNKQLIKLEWVSKRTC